MENATSITVQVTGATTSIVVEKLKATLAGFEGTTSKVGAIENKIAKKKVAKKEETIEDDFSEDDFSDDEVYAQDDMPTAKKKNAKSKVEETEEEIEEDFSDEDESEDEIEYDVASVTKILVKLGQKKGSKVATKVLATYGLKSIAELKSKGNAKYLKPIMTKASGLLK